MIKEPWRGAGVEEGSWIMGNNCNVSLEIFCIHRSTKKRGSCRNTRKTNVTFSLIFGAGVLFFAEPFFFSLCPLPIAILQRHGGTFWGGERGHPGGKLGYIVEHTFPPLPPSENWCAPMSSYLS